MDFSILYLELHMCKLIRTLAMLLRTREKTVTSCKVDVGQGIGLNKYQSLNYLMCVGME